MVTSRQLSLSSTRRDAWVEVDLTAIEQNVSVIKSWLLASENLRQPCSDPATSKSQVLPAKATTSATCKLMAVVKSDAYGHGVAGVTEVLVAAGADWLAVASVDEGCQIRAIDHSIPILVLSPVPAWTVPTALENRLDLTVTSSAQVKEIAQAAKRRGVRANIHLKVDSGMHRLGISPERLISLLQEIDNEKTALQLVSIFSHLAKADDLEASKSQQEKFETITQTVRQWQSELARHCTSGEDQPWREGNHANSLNNTFRTPPKVEGTGEALGQKSSRDCEARKEGSRKTFRPNGNQGAGCDELYQDSDAGRTSHLNASVCSEQPARRADLNSPEEDKNDLPLFFHLASGEAARRFPFTHYDMVRVGLYLYGLESNQVSQAVTPALSVRGRINHITEVEAGASVGYNWTWTANRPTRLATIPIGYADGVDRRLSNKMVGLLHGCQINQVGLISMDQMLFDVTDVSDVQEGDVITIIGSDGGLTIHLAIWAQLLGTITYELACRLRVRLPRIYTRHRATGQFH